MVFLFGRFLPRPVRFIAGIALLVLGIVFHLYVLAITSLIWLAFAAFVPSKRPDQPGRARTQ